jgi:hypothetical protein
VLCWGIAVSYKGMTYAKEGVRAVALKLKRLLDENGQTYHGQKIYGAKSETHHLLSFLPSFMMQLPDIVSMLLFHLPPLR